MLAILLLRQYVCCYFLWLIGLFGLFYPLEVFCAPLRFCFYLRTIGSQRPDLTREFQYCASSQINIALHVPFKETKEQLQVV